MSVVSVVLKSGFSVCLGSPRVDLASYWPT